MKKLLTLTIGILLTITMVAQNWPREKNKIPDRRKELSEFLYSDIDAGVWEKESFTMHIWVSVFGDTIEEKMVVPGDFTDNGSYIEIEDEEISFKAFYTEIKQSKEKIYKELDFYEKRYILKEGSEYDEVLLYGITPYLDEVKAYKQIELIVFKKGKNFLFHDYYVYVGE